MEELTQGIPPGSLPVPGSLSSSTALAATPPPRPSAPPASSLLGPPPLGPSGGGGAMAAVVDAGGGGAWCGPWPWEHSDASMGYTLALLQQPLVRAHLHVALPGSRGRAWSTGGHAHRRRPSRPVLVAVGSTYRDLARACRLGPDGFGPLFRHHDPDSSSRPRLDRRLGCYLPHHPQPWYTLFCSSSFFLPPFVHHGRQWFVSSCHFRGCRSHSWLFSSS